jgi:hypothetical protein
MKDPHVESLRYRVEVNEAYIRLDNPPPLEHETVSYRLRLADGVVTVEMKEHYASIATARQQVEHDLKAWELAEALERDQPWLKFVHDGAGTRIVDRGPSVPGDAGSIMTAFERADGFAAKALVGPPVLKEYPKPPAMFEPSPEVEKMIQRYRAAIFDESQLLTVGYACLSWLEGSADQPNRGTSRQKAALQYRIEECVLSKVGYFTSTRGGFENARKLKANAALEPLTSDETAWVRAALKKMIRRKAEYDGDCVAAVSLPMITMGDLPKL